MDWDTSSIDAMEATARHEADGMCAVKIRDHWLEVRYVESSRNFRYQWGKNLISREEAANILKTK